MIVERNLFTLITLPLPCKLRLEEAEQNLKLALEYYNDFYHNNSLKLNPGMKLYTFKFLHSIEIIINI